MGGEQAANTLFSIQKRAKERKGHNFDPDELEEMRQKIIKRYQEQMNIRYGAARGWVDAIIAPHTTRDLLIKQLQLLSKFRSPSERFHMGVVQV
jgi:acetyl-CoA carboxylase carboxyltransferase component